jgi:nucleotide-binding universal stress UspA family protein
MDNLMGPDRRRERSFFESGKYWFLLTATYKAGRCGYRKGGAWMKTLTARTAKTKPSSIGRIIAALDLNRDCEATLHYAAQMAGFYYASLYVTYVFWPPSLSEGEYYYLIDKAQREYARKLNHLVTQAREIAPRCRPALLVGEPAKRIAALARDVHADLIITTGYDPKFPMQLLDMSDAMRIVREAPCPVLICHEAGILERSDRPLQSQY